MKLEGVHEDILAVTHMALKYSKIDFGVTCGLRSQVEQNQLVITGKSQTKKSRHITGHAVDIVCYRGATVSWELVDYITAAQGFYYASKKLGVPLVWGACWLAPITEFKSSQKAINTYVDVRKKEGRKPFIDGPHFQLDHASYPSESK